jgi:DNA-binding transcriptional LysR family regulator
LSSALQKLELQIGDKLFNRDVKPLRATRFAQVFIDRGRQIAFERNEILRDIERLKGLESGKLTVATGMFAAEGSVEKAISHVVTVYPHLTIELLQNGWQQITESVLRGTTDLAVIELGLAETIPELETELVNGAPCFFFAASTTRSPSKNLSHGQTSTPFPLPEIASRSASSHI